MVPTRATGQSPSMERKKAYYPIPAGTTWYPPTCSAFWGNPESTTLIDCTYAEVVDSYPLWELKPNKPGITCVTGGGSLTTNKQTNPYAGHKVDKLV